ncbi:hypothetical protein H3N56_02690 [Cetobacterium sp. 2A]|uniref:hypothetical protein n=1 Tax=Cetobacterium sp. 2A TaxID=2754723 RepID=UPI00163BAE6C|nr:hypothetical protein [Cetobacterium sp. 2A]MBC2855401.1 hypothetical protein [Cetobacterium sp. 2A]
MEESKIICDNDFLSSFLWVGEEQLLVAMYGKRMHVPDAVRVEFEALKGTRLGNHVYNKFNEMIDNGHLKILTINVDSEEAKLMEKIRKDFRGQFRKEIGEGELQMVALAIHQKAIFTVNTASNNLSDIAYFVQQDEIKNITTMEVLCNAYENKLKDFPELEVIKKEMIKRKRRLPSMDVKEYHGNMYKK